MSKDLGENDICTIFVDNLSVYNVIPTILLVPFLVVLLAVVDSDLSVTPTTMSYKGNCHCDGGVSLTPYSDPSSTSGCGTNSDWSVNDLFCAKDCYDNDKCVFAELLYDDNKRNCAPVCTLYTSCSNITCVEHDNSMSPVTDTGFLTYVLTPTYQSFQKNTQATQNIN